MERIALRPGLRPRCLRIALGAFLLLSAFAHGPAAAGPPQWIDITSDAVQTFYQQGVPPLPTADRFFPNGLYFVTGGPEDANAIQTLHDAGFNVALASGRWDPAVYLDATSGTNVRIILDQSQHAHGTLTPTFNDEWFAAYKDDPRVLGWFLYDEPVGVMNAVPEKTDLLDTLAQIYATYSSQTDQVLFIDEQAAIQNPYWATVKRLADLAAHYSYLKSTLGQTQSIAPIAESVALQTQITEEQRPSWFIPQAFAGPAFGYAFGAFPTPAKALAQAYAAVIHGATGLIHFAWDSAYIRTFDVVGIRPDTPEAYASGSRTSPGFAEQSRALWAGLDTRSGPASLNRQLPALTEPLLSPTSALPYTVEVDQAPISPAPIRTLLKQYGGDLYLLAVNLDNATIQARLTFDRAYAVGRLFSGDGGGDWSTHQQIIDTFGPFDTRVYRLATCLDPDDSGSADTTDLTAIGAAAGSNAGFSPSYRLDWDYSGDGLLDWTDVQRFVDASAVPAPDCSPCADADGDSLTDCQEHLLGSDPSVAGTPCLPYQPDLDDDGLLNAVEFALQTDPCSPDTDADGLSDSYELANACLDARSADGVADPDSDGLANQREAALGTFPCVVDTDADGCSDAEELRDDPRVGGQRDPTDPYDFFDVPLPPGPPGSGKRDRAVSISDIRGVFLKYGTVPGSPPNSSGQVYNPDFDHTRAGPHSWQTGPGDGVVSISDVVLAIYQFGHNCISPP